MRVAAAYHLSAAQLPGKLYVTIDISNCISKPHSWHFRCFKLQQTQANGIIYGYCGCITSNTIIQMMFETFGSVVYFSDKRSVEVDDRATNF